MADNVVLPGTGETVAAKQIPAGSGPKYQRALLVGPDGEDLVFIEGNNGKGPGVVVLNDVPAVGLDADDAPMQTANYPLFMGGRVRQGTAILPYGSDGRARGLTLTDDGRVVTQPIGCPEDQGVTVPVEAANDTTRHPLLGAQVTGVKIALWGLECVNLTPTATSVVLYDGDTTTVIGRMGIPGNPGRPAYPQAAAIKTTAATALYYSLTSAVGVASLFFMPFWYKTRA